MIWINHSTRQYEAYPPCDRCQYLVVFTPKKSFAVVGVPRDFSELLPLEEARDKELYGEGALRQSWVLGKRDKGAACLFEADSPGHLQEVIDSFPLIKASYSDYEIIPLAPDPVFEKNPGSRPSPPEQKTGRVINPAILRCQRVASSRYRLISDFHLLHRKFKTASARS